MKTCSKYAPAMMDKRLELQRLVRTSDGQGGWTEAWETQCYLWAKLEPTKAYERYQAQQLETPVSHNITIRYLAGVTDKNRFKLGERIFVIKEVINVSEADTFLNIKAIERLA